MRRVRKRRGSDSGTLWISFSDLMSALMLIFVLIMFYAIYQYYDMLETKTAELLRQSGLLEQQERDLTASQEALDKKETELEQTQQALSDKEAELATQSDKLTETETALLLEQARLLQQQTTLEELEATLAAQQEELDAARADLTAAQTELSTAQADLTTAQSDLSEAQAAMARQQEQLDRLVGVRSEIIEDLVAALARSNISGASVDDSGAIVFSSEMMFDVGKDDLKAVGKNFLNSFIPGYLGVLMSDRYAPYVSQIIIEGQTDNTGSFLDNMQLSQDRARAVLEYILSDEFNGISPLAKRQLERIVTVNGRSYSDLIYNPNGTVNMAASRRVVIKFRMNDEDMVNEMINILEGMD